MKPAALNSTNMANIARLFFLAALALAAVIVPGAIPAPALAATPQVTNVLAIQRPGTKLVDVTYDVYDADGHAMTVALYISPDGGGRGAIQAVRGARMHPPAFCLPSSTSGKVGACSARSLPTPHQESLHPELPQGVPVALQTPSCYPHRAESFNRILTEGRLLSILSPCD